MPTTTRTDLVKQMYSAFSRNDIPTLLKSVGPNCEWSSPGPREIPWAGKYRGHDEISRFFKSLAEAADNIKMEPRKYVEMDDTVVVLGEGKLRSRRTGRNCEAHWAHTFTLSDGKVVAFREYTDTAALLKALSG
jgi:ketosteroid isomerase-like protein